MISRIEAEYLNMEIENLVAGVGVTRPDDMVDIEDVKQKIRSQIPEETKVEHHACIVEGLTQLYQRKNKDYGDSFGMGMKKYGMTMPLIRLEDKLNRLVSLVTSGEQHVKDESIRDTLLDLANYAIMTVVEKDLAGDWPIEENR